ncbi:Predicted nuclease of the RNAse H fold, HicB family [Oribacterium sp. KHPX15]|uniref:type II toxin-antitoxin system HicB family antitoxin n=1 Tax=unclassified Oribacterium TaxID=2629782 RepID=UPI0004E18969|nr:MULTISPECIES: type II toxin-antitoxin system HicB family antitoxin [unclassified Oribacterium]SDZ78715.1 Predicted nuclease of the RNAse H fold, HicB family [Oribacterium sp. KHPX15]
MKLVYTAIFDPNDDGSYTVTVPDLPGCVTEGPNLAEAIDMAVDAASGWILGELEEGNSIPSATPFFDVQLDDPNCFKSVLSLDMNAYAEKYSTKTVRKNITIPAWLNTYGEKNNINFSKILQDALLKQAENETRAKG